MINQCLNPRLNVYFEVHAGTSGFSCLQHIVDGSQPITIFNSLDKSVESFGDLDIPNFYNKHEIGAFDDELSSLIVNTCTNTEVYSLITNPNLVNNYTKNKVESLIYTINMVDYYTTT